MKIKRIDLNDKNVKFNLIPTNNTNNPITNAYIISLSREEAEKELCMNILKQVDYEKTTNAEEEQAYTKAFSEHNFMSVAGKLLLEIASKHKDNKVISMADISFNGLAATILPYFRAQKSNCYVQILAVMYLNTSKDADRVNEYMTNIKSKEYGVYECEVVDHRRKPHTFEKPKKTPKEIKEYLDKYVISQDEAKKAVSVAVYNHYKRIIASNDSLLSKNKIKKNNILIMGPSGSGKTEIAKSVAELLDVPFASITAASLTATGYVGSDVSAIFTRLLSAANNDVKKAENGVVFIDEFDKIATKNGSGRDIRGEDVQFELLKALEGDTITVTVGPKNTPYEKNLSINTENILFICAGAFSKMEEKSQEKKTKPLGFNSASENEDDDKKGDLADSLIKYGLIPELVGRVPVITETKSLSEDDLIRILVEPKDAIVTQYQTLFRIDGIKLSFEDGALKEIAKKAATKKVGARALQGIVNEMMEPIMFSAPNIENLKSITITEKYANGTEGPLCYIDENGKMTSTTELF